MRHLARKFRSTTLDQNGEKAPLLELPLEAANSTKPEYEIGQLFKEARRQKNLSLKQIADKLHIRTLYLDAIETGRLEKLPSPLYAQGFIRLYAKYLGLEGDEMLRRIHLKEEDAFAPSILPVPVVTQPPRLAYVVSAILTALSLAIAYLVLSMRGEDLSLNEEEALLKLPDSSFKKEESTAPPFKETVTKEIPIESFSQALSPSLPPQKHEGTSENSKKPHSQSEEQSLTFKAHQNCWMEIDKNGVIVFSRILKEGEAFTLPSPKDHRLSVGNAMGLSFSYGGRDFKNLSTEARVMKNIRAEDLCRSE